MADGGSKPIEDVEVGDEVVATDPETGETGAREVTKTIVGKGAKDLVRVTIDTDGRSGSQTASVVATDGHPFWVALMEKWVDATDLRRGQWLQTSAGTWVQITEVDRFSQRARVHNLTVKDLHTYHVLAGNTPVLVHSTGGMDGCSDAAYQGVLHVREEAAKEAAEGSARSHHFDISDDQLADYLDGFAGRSDGVALKRGGVGWYDAEQGVTVIQRGEYSMTAFRESAEAFAKRKAS
jgi:hypothetical protein